ncbi:MAG: hypothetical protein KAY32_03830 [Candidatus Eisenbacteria sp.]|nr:hypothetical protein [Candidatus Eisenbacteria bacterium]
MNPRPLHLTICLLTLVVAGTTAGAQQQQIHPKGYLHLSLGYATQALGEVNDAIEDDEQIFRSLGVPLSWDTFGGALEFGGGLEFMVSETVSLGASVGIQKSSVNNVYSDYSGSFSDKADLRVIDVSGTLTLWPPTSRGLFLGASMGVAFGKANSETRFRVYSDSDYDLDVEGEFTGKGLSLGVFSGYQGRIGRTGLLFVKAGYRHRNLGEFDGEFCSPQVGCWDTEAQNNAGQALDFDFSGFYLAGGVGFALGR